MSRRHAGPAVARQPDVPSRGAAAPKPDVPSRGAAEPGPDTPSRGAAEPELKELGRAALARASASEQERERERERSAPPREPDDAAEAEGNDPTVDLARVAWLVTVLACLLTVTILALDGYVGYAGVALAVALAAGINLL